MTPVEWVVAVAVLASLWVTALWFFFVGAKKADEMEEAHQEAESIRNEIARWRAAQSRTFERQHIAPLGHTRVGIDPVKRRRGA
jgi:Tfp pilus assembly protein PilO